MNIRKRTWTWHGQKRTGWQLDSRAHGTRERKLFRTRQEAELYHNKLIREQNADRYGTLVEEGMTFDAFTPTYFEKKPWRTETYRERADWSVKALATCFGAMRLAAITPMAIEDYQRTRLKDVAASTVRQEIATLSDVFKWAMKLRYADRNPTRHVERPSLPVKQDDPAQYLTPEQFADLVGEAGQDRPLYKFAVWTGLRLTELLLVEWADIRDGFVVVRRGKGRKQRIVPLLPQALEALKEAPRRLKEPRVFWWMRDRFTTLRRFKRRLGWAKLPTTFHFHHLRHCFGSYAAQAGVHLEVIAQAMGHSSTSVTRLYAHLSPDYRRKELLKMAKLTVGTRRAQRSRKAAKN